MLSEDFDGKGAGQFPAGVSSDPVGHGQELKRVPGKEAPPGEIETDIVIFVPSPGLAYMRMAERFDPHY